MKNLPPPHLPCALVSRFGFQVIALMCVFIGALAARADINTINQTVWKMQYGVADAQMADTNWLDADNDGDGVGNGEEIAAGTNPFDAGKVVKITSITTDASNVSLFCKAMKGKQYVVQGSATLSDFASLSPSVFWNATSESTHLLVAPKGTNKFFRVLVQDIDTDSDGVSDWAEYVVGYNPNSPMSNGLVADGAALTAALANENKVSITATDPTALQPEGANAPVDVGQVTVARSGTLHFSAITVSLSKTGTAIEGTDYASLPGTVVIPKNSGSVVLEVMPVANASLKTNRVAMVTVLPGGGYTLLAPSSASVAINPAGVANGTGLTARYQNTSSSNYTTQTGIFAGTVEMTRTDAVVDFGTSANTIVASISLGHPCVVTTTRATALAPGDSVTIAGVSGGTFSPSINGTFPVTVINGTSFTVPVNCTAVPTAVTSATLTAPNGWNTVAGPTGLSPVSTNGAYSVLWTGQILPQFSETYTIDFRSDDGAKVWVNGVLLIDRWLPQGATDYTNTIALQAGTLYDITIEYFNNSTGGAEAKLYWWSPSQIKQIIPQGRLFPAPAQAAKFTAITSALTAVGYVSVPFSFTVTTPIIGGTTTYELASGSAPLPPGLSLAPATGLISGTPTTAGSYNVAINATNVAAGTVTGSSIVDFIIFPTGSVTRETLAGAVITADGTIPTVDDDTDYPNNTSRRLRGYIVPPKTGNYYFWLAANNTAEFWLSTDAESVNAVRRAVVTSSTGKKDWNSLDTSTTRPQMTQWLSLVAGEKYYFEVLHNTGADADDYLGLGWCQDDAGTIVAVTGAANGTGTTPSIPDGGAARQGYPFSGTVPSYLCQPYDYPIVASSTGTLYAANLGPQGSSTTKASGSANLRVDASGNSAVLHFSYSGLSSPRTGYHLHVDAFSTHPAGEIVFDIDDIDSFHPDLITADGGYIWNFATVGTFTTIQQIRDAITLGKVYLNVHSVNYPNGEIRGTLTLVDGSQTPPDPLAYVEPTATDDPTNYANAARFLNQASFGATPSDVALVQAGGASGFLNWFNDQITKPASRSSNEVVAGITADINTPYPSSLFTNAWWKQSITGQDQLRQRLAFALSEIMVISWGNNSGPLADNGRILADYYDQIVDYCLPTPDPANPGMDLPNSGNFRGILKQVSLTPAMGLYLDMRGNQKGDDTIGRHPNENYAREIMQLFSIGLNRMWDDGRFVIDSNANLVPTYTQPSIIGLATLLTGWNYAQALQASGRLPTSFGPAADYLNPMVLVPLQHEIRYHKLLLNNVVSPMATGITPRVPLSSITATSPCVVNTATVHGLKVGDTIMISNVTGGSFTVPINASHQVTEIVDGDSFKVASNCSIVPTSYTNAAVTGVTVTPAAISGTGGVVTAVTGSQADNAGSTVPHPYDQYGLNELETAMNNIFNNDNVPPYICRLLIQRLVTSDPSPGYVYRVVQKFRNNGSGVRGDLAAVVKQILLDGEARSTGLPFATAEARNAFGKQREPMLRLTCPARAFPATSYTGTYSQLTGVNSNKFRIVTSAPNDFNAGFSVALNFQGNYVTPQPSPPNPHTNPTSTTYSIGTTLGIAGTHTDITSIGTGNPTVITTAQPHGLVDGNTATITGVSGTFVGTSLNSTQTVTMLTSTSYSVPINTTRSFQVASIATGNPCTITTAAAHGLTNGDSVTLNGVGGGVFSPAITGTLTVTVVDATNFTVASGVTPVNCTSPPTSYTTWREVSNPCRVTTVSAHGLTTGDTVTIAGVNGTTSPSINATYGVTVLDATSFSVPGVNCTVAASPNTGSIVGGNTLDVNATGMVNVTYSQPAGSNVMTVMTGGPQTDVAIPVPNSATTTLKSKVYLDVLTSNGSAAITSISTAYPCEITTAVAHGLTTGNSITISGVAGGLFSPAINGTYTVTVTGANTFTILTTCTRSPIASISTGSPCTVTTMVPHGLANGASYTISGVSGGTFSPAINAAFTITVTGTNTFTVPSNCTVVPTIAPIISGSFGTPATDGVYEVQTTNGSTSFTVATADTPVTARAGNVIVPKISTSYTPLSSNTIVQFNNNVNHNMLVGQNVWVDVPVVGSPVTDAEYIITETADEDHFKTSYLPVTSGLSTTFPKPSGSNNGITLFPLVAPPMGRSGSLVINQSTFNLGSTESTLAQSPLNAPTVFNFFFPDYKFPGTLSNLGIDSPEFQLSTDTNLSNLTNSLTNMFIGTGGSNGNLNGLSSFSNGNGTVVVDIGSYMTNAKTADAGIPGLIDELAYLLVGMPLDATPKLLIQNFVTGRRITAISTGNPCTITTSGNHLLTSGTSVTISGVTGGTFSPAINGTYTVTVPVGSTNTFTVPVNCTSITTLNVTNAFAPLNFPYTTPTPTALQKRDRVRAIIHLIITSAQYAVQK